MVWLKPENLTDICGHFQIFAASSDICGIFRYLAVSSDICGHLQISAGIFRYLQISPTHQRNIDLSYGIYRKPAAAARHLWSLQASPKPGLRSPGLSHTGLAWPDWKPAGYLEADLAACEHWSERLIFPSCLEICKIGHSQADFCGTWIIIQRLFLTAEGHVEPIPGQ